MSNQDRLATVAAAFQQWRQTRAYVNARTPEHLRNQAVALLAHHTSGVIATTLAISGGSLKAWSRPVLQAEPVSEFVALPDAPAGVPSTLALDLSFANGASMRLAGDLSPTLVTALAQVLLAEGSAAS